MMMLSTTAMNKITGWVNGVSKEDISHVAITDYTGTGNRLSKNLTLRTLENLFSIIGS